MSNEDIKVIENIIYNDQGKKMSYVDVDYAEGKKFINAIENLIKRNKELETINKIQEYRISVIDERELIPKSKIREKIEELNSIYQQEIKQKYNGRYYYQLSYAIQILKGLEGDK